MKLKYYLRTLGMAMIVTTLLLGVSTPEGREPMSDQEIRERAIELGMIDADSLSLSELRREPEEGDPVVQNPGEEGESEEAGSDAQDPEETDPEEDSAVQNPEEIAESGEGEAEPAESVIITIKSGDTSVSVSRKLAEAGLVSDAKEYDSYLCKGGYDKALSVGTYEIPIGSSEEEIAKIITKKR